MSNTKDTKAFLAECEAKANEAKCIAEKATEGPWETDGGSVVETVNPIDGGDYCLDVCEVLHRGKTKSVFRSDTAVFIAHARTSNPDLADRVLKLIEMVRERDERIANQAERERVLKADYVHVINAQENELMALRRGIGQPPIKAGKGDF